MRKVIFPLLAAVDYLSKLENVDAGRIGILGICGWGGIALNAAQLLKEAQKGGQSATDTLKLRKFLTGNVHISKKHYLCRALAGDAGIVPQPSKRQSIIK